MADIKRTVDEILAELDAMAGMAEVKKTVRELANKLALQMERREASGKTFNSEGNHIVLTGNPGTDKTAIVRILAKLFKAIGFLANDKLLEIQGADLKAAYIGMSKVKVNEYCDQAMGGVLFIDEVHWLGNEQGPADTFAEEALDALLMRLENDKDKFICIVADNPKEVETFLKKSNPGMRRRFMHYINLSDHSAEEEEEEVIFEKVETVQTTPPMSRSILCGKCGKENPAEAKFCFNCGAPCQKTFCSMCGKENSAGAKFCSECRAPLVQR